MTVADQEQQAGLLNFVNLLARFILSNRRSLLVVFSIITLALAYSATHLHVDAGFNKIIPLQHEYMKTFTQYQKTFGGANRIVVALSQKQGDVFNAAFFEKLKDVTDEVFFIPGVDRATVTSLFTPNVRFIEVVEEGFVGGNVIPAGFKGSAEDLKTVRDNVLKSDRVGRLVSNDFKAALVSAELLELDPTSEKRLDYQSVAKRLENIRSKYQTDETRVHIIGFAKGVGDISDGATSVIKFFLIAFVITAMLLVWYLRSFKLAMLALICALIPVVWLLGLLPLMGFGIDPMSILAPFLIFSIGVSHAVQMVHAWKLETINRADSVTASVNSFNKLFIPGSMALLANALGFIVIMHIKISMVQEMAITASLGVVLMIITNKMLLPILLSYTQLRFKSGAQFQEQEERSERIWFQLGRVAQRRNSIAVLFICVLLLGLGVWKAQDLRTGDLGKGIPELQEDSRYNRDNAAIVDSFTVGVGLLSVVVQGSAGACTDYDVMDAIDRFAWVMRNIDGVHFRVTRKSWHNRWHRWTPVAAC